MNHLGDITKINGTAAPIVDCIIGGSPCQDLSVAGKRAGLAGERSGLYMEQIRIIKEMRASDRANGRSGEFIRPRYMVWENVPGAFSSNHGKDFAAVLEEAVRVIEPEAPPVPVPEKGWPTSGCLMGDGWSVAWRVLDAQFWGVPQRRRRIVLIADFGGQSAPEILFIRKSMSGDSEPGSETREGFAGGSAESTGSSVYCLQGNGIDRADTARCNGRGWKENVSYTLNTIDRPAVCAGFKLGNSEKARSIGYCEEQAPTLNAECGGNKPAILDMSHACDVIRDCGGIVPSLQARMGTGGNQVPLTYQDVTGTLSPGAHAGSYNGQDAYNDMLVCGAAVPDIAHTLKAKANLDSREDSETYPVQSGKVRRMTPLECERLQGFPDGWTDIGEWVDSKGKKRQTADSSRYKALGNSIALPPWKWVLKRLCAQYERDATMASLFDGISGFCLIWEQLNGKGSVKWCSEIEEFPIAVCKKHFGDEQTNEEGDLGEILF
jgi:DNA (cytosine-5)-methyltransferase 1